MNCAICNKSLEVVAELKTVKNPMLTRAEYLDNERRIRGLPPFSRNLSPTIQKHVRTKPRQVVITVRSEGSTGPEGPVFRGYEVRICTSCANGRGWLELLAVWLDRQLEGRPR